ncbi:hypothetical protein ACVA51_14995 [Pseudomonas luteola]|nr:hypothetical protein [Pseudomonas luteola]
MSTLRPASLIADDAIDIMGFAMEHSKWLAAIAIAIQGASKDGKNDVVTDLANLAQYLAQDCEQYMIHNVQLLQQELTERPAANSTSKRRGQA